MATSIYDGFHKISGVNFKLCACLIPADSWGKIVSWDTCWTLDDPFRTAKVWKIEILFRHQGAQGAVTLPQKNKIRRQDFKLVNLGNWLEDIEDMWDLYSYVDCQCHYILLQCIFFLLNIYIYMYQSYYLNTFLNYDITIVIDHHPPPPQQQQHHLFFLEFHQFKAQEGSPLLPNLHKKGP